MPTFVIESYLAAPSPTVLAVLAKRAHELGAGTSIRHLGSLALAEDEVCFHVFDADSLASLVAASDGSSVRCERVVEAIWVANAPRDEDLESA